MSTVKIKEQLLSKRRNTLISLPWRRRHCIFLILGITIPIMGISASTHAPQGVRHKAADQPVGTPTRLADALFTTTQQRVLALLFGQPDRSFFTSELIRLTGSGSGAVQRELQRLATSRLVTVTSVGTQKHYQANPACPVYRELVGIVRKTVALVEPIRQALEPFVERIVLAMLYGSFVRGTDTADSDIDLLVVGNGLMLEDLYAALAPVEMSLARKISLKLYTVSEFNARRSARHPFLMRVLEGENLALIGDKDGESATG